MLVLFRKPDEQIAIAEDIVITVLEIREGTVRLGIQAPTKTPIHRMEVYEAIGRTEKQQAARGPGDETPAD